MRNRMLIWAVALAGVAMTCRPANAQVVYEFASNTSPFNAFGSGGSVSVAPSGSVTIRVYIHDTAAGAPTLSAGGGMTAAGIRVTSSNTAVSGSPTIVPATTGATPAGPWTFGTILGGTANSGVINDGAIAAAAPDTAGRILLGTFTYVGGSGGSSTLTMAAPNPAGDNVNGSGGAVTIGAGNALTLNVTAVPEPSSLLLGGLGLTGLAAIRRRRKAAAAEATV